VLHFPNGPVVLTHEQNNFQVQLSTISYESFGKINYRYKLEGLTIVDQYGQQ